MKVLAFSYAKQVLREGSREQVRILDHSKELDDLVMVVFTRRRDKLPTFFKEGNLTVYGTNARTSLGIVFRALRTCLQQSFKKKDDWVVSSQDVFVSGLLAYSVSLIKGIHLHVQIHEDLKSVFVNSRSNKAKLVSTWVIFLLKRAKKIRVVSKRIQHQLVEVGVAKNKVVVLPVFASLDSFLSVGSGRVYKAGDHSVFLYVGRFEPVKNLSLLLNAFKIAYDTNRNIKLRLIGGGSEQTLIEEKINRLQLCDAAEIIPWVDDVAGEMKKADVFVLTSKQEGYALVLLEAMAAGLPVVTTDVGCVGEVVIPGVHGEVVDSEVKKISKAMLSFSIDEEKRKRYGRASYESALVFEKASHTYLSQWRDSFEIK